MGPTGRVLTSRWSSSVPCARGRGPGLSFGESNVALWATNVGPLSLGSEGGDPMPTTVADAVGDVGLSEPTHAGQPDLAEVQARSLFHRLEETLPPTITRTWPSCFLRSGSVLCRNSRNKRWVGAALRQWRPRSMRARKASLERVPSSLRTIRKSLLQAFESGWSRAWNQLCRTDPFSVETSRSRMSDSVDGNASQCVQSRLEVGSFEPFHESR